MSEHEWTTHESKKLAAEYRELVRKQRAMPLEEQWKMAPAIREVHAKFIVEREYEKTGIRK